MSSLIVYDKSKIDEMSCKELKDQIDFLNFGIKDVKNYIDYLESHGFGKKTPLYAKFLPAVVVLIVLSYFDLAFSISFFIAFVVFLFTLYGAYKADNGPPSPDSPEGKLQNAYIELELKESTLRYVKSKHDSIC